MANVPIVQDRESVVHQVRTVAEAWEQVERSHDGAKGLSRARVLVDIIIGGGRLLFLSLVVFVHWPCCFPPPFLSFAVPVARA